MDKLDWKILQALDWKGREPHVRIAKAVRSSKTVVAYRINRLEQQGIIAHYYPVLDMSKLGYFTSRIMLDVEDMEEAEEKAFIAFLDKEMNAGLIFRMDYPYRWGLFLWTKTMYELEEAIVRIKRKLGRTLLRYNYALVCTFRQYPKDYLFGSGHHDTSRSLEPAHEMPHDSDDFRILRELAHDASLSTAEIARRLKISQTTVSNKIRTLERKGIIMGYRAQIDISKLGHVNYFLEVYLDENDNLAQIEAWANVNKNVVWLQKIIGTCDIELEVEVKDRAELEKFLYNMRSTFKNIRKIIYFQQEYSKFTYMP